MTPPGYADQVGAVGGDRSAQLSWEAQFLATSYVVKTYQGDPPAGGDSRQRLEASEWPDLAAGMSDFGHIVVDEAQDLSPMQWRMLARRGRDATWTVVADPRQATLSSPDELEAAIARTLSARRTQRFILEINYRTPRQIMEYAAEASGLDLGGLRSIRDGDEPVVFAGDPEEAIKQAAAWLDDQPGSGSFMNAAAGKAALLAQFLDVGHTTARN